MSIAELFISISLSIGLPDGLLSAMCFVESNHQTQSINYNDGGSKSIGICQIKLKTAKEMGFKGTKEDLLKPDNNIKYAGLYLKKCYSRYNNWARAVTCYNKGHSDGHGGSDYVAKVFNRMLYKTKIEVIEKKTNKQ